MTIPARLLPITVDWIRPEVTTDAYGNTISDYDAATPTPLAVMIEQRQTVEQLDNRDATVTTLVLFTNELGVAAVDRFIWDAATFGADGDPWVVYSPAGPHHAEIRIRRVEG